MSSSNTVLLRSYKLGINTMNISYFDDHIAINNSPLNDAHGMNKGNTAIEYADPELFDKLAIYIKDIV